MARASWRQIETPGNDAAWNMAVDEALLLHAGEMGPSFRLYRWDPPALSLGYRQRDTPWPERAAELGIDVVRRISGGGSVLHAGDLTYALVVPHGTPGVPGRMRESYLWVRELLLRALRGVGVHAVAASGDGNSRHGDRQMRPDASQRAERGHTDAAARVSVCFRASTGMEIDGAVGKLVGSAQRRTHSAFLQHGSIRLADDSELQRALFGTALPEIHPDSRLEGCLRECLIESFQEALGIELMRATLSDSEAGTARDRRDWRGRHPGEAPPLRLSSLAAAADRLA